MSPSSIGRQQDPSFRHRKSPAHFHPPCRNASAQDHEERRSDEGTAIPLFRRHADVHYDVAAEQVSIMKSFVASMSMNYSHYGPSDEVAVGGSGHCARTRADTADAERDTWGAKARSLKGVDHRNNETTSRS